MKGGSLIANLDSASSYRLLLPNPPLKQPMLDKSSAVIRLYRHPPSEFEQATFVGLVLGPDELSSVYIKMRGYGFQPREKAAEQAFIGYGNPAYHI